MGPDALRLDVSLGGGRLRKVNSNAFASSEMLFVPSAVNGDDLQPPIVCGAGRANVVRLSKCRWTPGMNASAVLEFAASPSDSISVVVSVRLDETRSWKESRSLRIERLSGRE